MKTCTRAYRDSPTASNGKSWKLTHLFCGLYHVLSMSATDAEVRLVDYPKDPAVFVSLNHVQPCYA